MLLRAAVRKQQVEAENARQLAAQTVYTPPPELKLVGRSGRASLLPGPGAPSTPVAWIGAAHGRSVPRVLSHRCAGCVFLRVPPPLDDCVCPLPSCTSLVRSSASNTGKRQCGGSRCIVSGR